MHNSPGTAVDGCKHSAPRLLRVTDSPTYSTSVTGWYIRMPTNTPHIDAKVKVLLTLM